MWDKLVVPMPKVERQLLSGTDVQQLRHLRRVTTEAASLLPFHFRRESPKSRS